MIGNVSSLYMVVRNVRKYSKTFNMKLQCILKGTSINSIKLLECLTPRNLVKALRRRLLCAIQILTDVLCLAEIYVSLYVFFLSRSPFLKNKVNLERDTWFLNNSVSNHQIRFLLLFSEY